MTLQEIVNRNWQFFIRERGLPGVKGDDCVYRAPNGGRCAIGCVLPKRVRADDCCISNLLETNATVAEFFDGVPSAALEELMSLHDEFAHHTLFHTHYKNALREFASNWKLTIPDSYLLDDVNQLLLFEDAVPGTQRPLTFIEMKRAHAARPIPIVER